MEKIIWGMIGCGDVTERKNGPGLYKAEGSVLKGVYSRTYERAADYARRHGLERVYASAQEMLQDKEIQAVYIATPPLYHRDYALMCLEAGKIPYLEKPVANTYEECLEIQKKSHETGLPVYAAFYRRGLEKYRFIKQVLERGELGKLRTVRISQYAPVGEEEKQPDTLPWRLLPSQTLGGKLIDSASHSLDLLFYLFGDLQLLRAEVQNLGGFYEPEDTVHVLLQDKSGMILSGSWCYVSGFSQDELLLVGERGYLRTEALSYGDVIVSIDGTDTRHTFQAPEHIGQPFEQELVRHLLGIGEGNFSGSFADAIAVTKLLDQILEGYRREHYPQLCPF